MLLTFSLLCACSNAYYSTMEKFGVHKREIMADRVADARSAQEDGVETFESALEQFRSVVSVNESNLSKFYDKLNAEYERSEAAAEEIRARIDDFEDVSSALFREWEDELETYDNQRLKNESKVKLDETKSRYKKLISSMESAESKLGPALTVMHDQVLYLKHNLNASAISSLKAESLSLDRDVEALLSAMSVSIEEAERFIAELE